MVRGKSYPKMHKIEIRFPVTPYTKNNSQQIRDINLKHERIKLLEKNTGKTWQYISRSKEFLDKKIKAKINQQDYAKLRKFCTSKETQNKGAMDRMGKIFKYCI